ncbi:MAG: sigma-70 family RNA polymerase sigma factor [Bacteroidetes bacterium]|nr:sigma-70 family RNA polymerase sigma factor [Bacteroidota bacterium]
MQGLLHTEQVLLADLAKGKREATEQIYNQHYPVITKWIQNNGGSEDDAADVYQEAMVILYEKSQDENFRLSCKIGTYLFAIGKHLWYKKLNRQQQMPASLPDDAENDGRLDWAYEDDVNAHRERELYYSQLNVALEQLGEPCSSLLKAFYQQDKSMQEIAEQFGYTNTDNAKTQKYKCLARLRKLFYKG